jgi:hypothetical protein
VYVVAVLDRKWTTTTASFVFILLGAINWMAGRGRE